MIIKLSIESKKYFLSVLFWCIPFFMVNADEIELEGIYKGENIYVENPYSSSGVGFCVSEVLVNDFTTTDEINSSFFEIDLSIYGFKYGDFIKIIIRYKDDCLPRILNNEVIVPFSTFKIKSINITGEAFIEWTTLNEHGSLNFIIEQYRWNKWVRVGSVKGKGTDKLNRYRYSIDFHTGMNKFRVKQIGSDKKPNYSQSVEYTNDEQEVTFIPGNQGKVNDKIFFSAFTHYEIYDYYGKRIKTGAAHDIDVSKFNNGTYFLNYDNKTEIFIKK